MNGYGCGCLGEVGRFLLSVALLWHVIYMQHCCLVLHICCMKSSLQGKVDLIVLDSDILPLEMRATPQTLQPQPKKPYCNPP